MIKKYIFICVKLYNLEYMDYIVLIFNNVVTQNLPRGSIKEEVFVEIAGRIGGMGGFKTETSHKSINATHKR